jgi:hypothetical protein
LIVTDERVHDALVLRHVELEKSKYINERSDTYENSQFKTEV